MNLEDIDRLLLQVAEIMQREQMLDYRWIEEVAGIEFRIRITGFETSKVVSRDEI